MRIIIEFDNGATATHDVSTVTGAPGSTYGSAPGTVPSRAATSDAGSAPVQMAELSSSEPGASTPGAPVVRRADAQSAGSAPKVN